MDESGVRQSQASKARARALLFRLGGHLEQLSKSGYAPGRKFKREHVKRRDERLVIPFEPRPDPETMKRLTESTFNILEAIAKDQIPQDQDLDFLTEVLNVDNDPIRFRPDGDDQAHWVREPYRRRDRIEALFAKD